MQRKYQWRIQGRGLGARSPPPPPPTLFLDQTEARRAEKIFGDRPRSLSKGLDDPHPYLEV